MAPDSEQAVLPAFSTERARSIQGFLHRKLGGACILGGPELVDELPGGGAVLRPAVILLDRPDPARLGIELPFPCVWVAPWSKDDFHALGNSLVVTAFAADDALADRLVADSSIRNLHLGGFATHVMAPELPHDGYIAELLMRGKTVLIPGDRT